MLAWPADGEGLPLVTRALEDLAREHHSEAVCAVPLFEAGQALGGLVLERISSRPFDAREQELCRQAGALWDRCWT